MIGRRVEVSYREDIGRRLLMMARQRMRVSMAKLFDKMEDWKTHTFWIAKWFPTDRDKGTSVRQLPYPLLIKVPHDLGQYRQPFSHRIGQVHKHHSENSAESGTPPSLIFVVMA
jgi:hypothetical protein